MADQQEGAAEALEEAWEAADLALRQVTGWCEAIGENATRRIGELATTGPEMAHLQALSVRGRLADAVRKLQGAAEEFRQVRT
ncbi:hypothetical protein [Actinomadura violacea]|uniref:Uncharacterized protein n=1 Tax=Actinomadura violacea TaxID=2819934 RepID=A0ABS3RN23_9ACTN|nr:hypothetical protein [Actinomadura violacea]MBO2458150.1 hypothetical protein [Actinomadura violacea]